MKLAHFFVLTCYLLVETSEASNYLESLNEELLKKCPWLTGSTVGVDDDGVKKCIMTFEVQDLKKMAEAAFQARANEISKLNAAKDAAATDVVEALKQQANDLQNNAKTMIAMAVIDGVLALVGGAAAAAAQG